MPQIEDSAGPGLAVGSPGKPTLSELARAESPTHFCSKRQSGTIGRKAVAPVECYNQGRWLLLSEPRR